MKITVPIFIPSYHRPNNLKTIKYFSSIGYPTNLLHVFIDDATDDIEDYRKSAKEYGFNLHIFSMEEARLRYDYVHRPSPSRRSAGQARNMFYDIARELGIDFYVVQDDDTTHMELQPFGHYFCKADLIDIVKTFEAVKEFMQRQRIGMFGLSQTGDIFDNSFQTKLFRAKVMNTTFVNTKYIYRGERGVQNNDTSQFVSIMNMGLFTGSLASGLILSQTVSATAKGGLTDLYFECRLLNKALVPVIQFPSAIKAEWQRENGGRVHHHITNKFLFPKIVKSYGKRSNIAWDTYPEDVPFTNEPIRTNGKV